MVFCLKSRAFLEGAKIPEKYTCESSYISPELSWQEAPKGTKSYALIVDDPDAPCGNWVHWVLYDLPASEQKLAESVPKTEELPSGAKQGITDFGRIGYWGPCPPKGAPHRYCFTLYALDCFLHLPAKINKEKLEKAMDGHILGKTVLMGRFGR
jgi:Raf kinase inhibitor-like YbhB/YbcL family protein